MIGGRKRQKSGLQRPAHPDGPRKTAVAPLDQVHHIQGEGQLHQAHKDEIEQIEQIIQGIREPPRRAQQGDGDDIERDGEQREEKAGAVNARLQGGRQALFA